MPHGRYLFVSDLHLDASSPEALTQFHHFLERDARQCDGLYILGDLFETWIGDDDDDAARSAVCLSLRKLVQAGTPCWVTGGNRDFLLGSDFEQRTGCRLLPDPALLQAGTLRAVICHGDLLCTADHGYQQFRTFAHGEVFQKNYLRLPLPTRRAFARMVRSSSMQRTSQMREDIMDVDPAAVESALRCGASSLLIHGHTHRPGVHQLQVDGRPATRIVLGDWYEQGSCLVLNTDGSHELLTLPRATSGSTVSIAPSSSRV